MSERRDAYVEKLKARLDEWNKKIDDLEERAHKVGTESRAEIQKQIDNAKTKRTEFEQSLEHLRKAGDGAWKELKRGAKNSWKALDKAVRSAAAKFRQPPLKNA